MKLNKLRDLFDYMGISFDIASDASNPIKDPTKGGRTWPYARRRRILCTPEMRYSLRSALERQLGCGHGVSIEKVTKRQERVKGFLHQLAKSVGVAPP